MLCLKITAPLPMFVFNSALLGNCLCNLSVVFRACILANWRARTHSALCVFHPNMNFASFERWTCLAKQTCALHLQLHRARTVIAVTVLLHSKETNCSFVFFTCLTRLRNREATGSQHLVRWRTSGLLTCLPVAGSLAVRLHFLAAYVASLWTCNNVLYVCKTTPIVKSLSAMCMRCYCDS